MHLQEYLVLTDKQAISYVVIEVRRNGNEWCRGEVVELRFLLYECLYGFRTTSVKAMHVVSRNDLLCGFKVGNYNVIDEIGI